MSKKLLIAVLIGLLFTYVGSAVAGSDIRGLNDRQVRKMTNPNAPDYGKSGAQVIPNHAQKYGRPPGTETLVKFAAPVVPVPVPKLCDTLSYAANWAAYVQVPNNAGYTKWDQRFESSAFGYKNDGYATCSLKVVHVALYPGGFVGTPDLVVEVWDDDGLGYPGALLATVTVPYATLSTIDPGGGYADVAMPQPYPVVHGKYHVSITTADPATTRVGLLVDDATNGHCVSEIFFPTPSPVWYTRCELSYSDRNADIIVDQCCIDPAYSDCNIYEYDCNVGYFWNVPNPTVTRDYMGMRFTADQPDSLRAVYVVSGTSYAIGTPDLGIGVYGGSAGLPDLSSPIYTTVIPWASQIPDDWNVVYPPAGTMVTGDFFVVASSATPGQSIALFSDDGTCGVNRGVVHNPVSGIWQTLLGRYGLDANFMMAVELCKDMYSLCKTVAVACPDYYIYSLPANNGSTRVGLFQRIDAAGVGSRLGKVRIPIDVVDAATTGTFPAEVRVYSNDGPGGSPNTLLGTIAIAPPYFDYYVDGKFNEVDFSSMNIRFDGYVYVGIVSLSPNVTGPADMYAVCDDGACGLNPTNMWAFFATGSPWGYYPGMNFLAQADICSVPSPERTCLPGESWPTSGHDFRRSAASMNATGDAKCKQVLQWAHNDAAGFAYTRPVIYDTLLIVSYSTKLQAFSINGNPATPIWTIGSLPYMGGANTFSNTVTVKDGFVYFGGGNAKSFNKANAYTGAIIWSRNPLASPLNGNTQYNPSVVLTQGVDEVVYTTTETGGLYAIDAATGLNWGGWLVNPVLLDGEPWQTLSSDPSRNVLYVGTDGANTTGYGSLYCIDAATGAIVWQKGELTGLQGHVLDGDTSNAITTEIFQGPIAVDEDGKIFVTTSFNAEVDGAPSGGKYAFNPDGSLIWAKGFKFGRYAGPVIDKNNVYMQTLRAWSSENTRMEAVNKLTGALAWQSDVNYDGMAWVEGALSCEPNGAPDILYMPNQSGQFIALNTVTGLAMFQYNYKNPGTSPWFRSCGVALDPSHVVMTNRQGDFFVFQTGTTDRARLQILKTNELASVPFFSPNPTTVTYADVFMNNGCVNLTGTLSASSTPSAIVTSVAPDRIARMSNTADAMVNNSYADMAGRVVKAMRVSDAAKDADFTNSALSKDTYSNTAAYAPPSWLNSITNPAFDVAPGGTYSIDYSVNGPLVTRGPHYCYVTITSNDQYYQNTSTAPVVQLGVLGGCMKAEGSIIFGQTSQNSAPVYNTGELQNQASVQFGVDGTTGHFFQGGMFYAMSKHRLAYTGDNWSGGANWWNTLLPDINVCGSCEPTITSSPIHLVDMWNGTAYAPVNGYVSTASYIDSVINYDCHGSWNWYTGRDCPFVNDSTIGLKVNQWVYGVVGEASPLNNLIIYRHDITNRNNRILNAVTCGDILDFDLSANTFDIMKFDAANNVARSFSCSTVGNKLVMGVGGIDNPIVNTRSLDANQFMWASNGAGMDSVYIWASTLVGETQGANIDANYPCAVSTSDREQFVTFMKRNFAANESYTTGWFLYQFNSADPADVAFYASMATLVKQMCGFNRGDINNDGVINLADVVALQLMVNGSAAFHPLFQHLADVNNSGGAPDMTDVTYLANYWFCSGPAPVGAWVLPTAICP